MIRVRILALCLLASACAGGHAPRQLAGLWSAGPAACAAGVGVRFDDDEIAIVYDRQRQTLFERPRYFVESAGPRFRIRILYDLPRRPGGARVAGAYGVLVLDGAPGAPLHPESHNLIDSRTGSARLRITGDPAISALALKPCGTSPHSGQENLRGRGAL